MGRVDSDVWSIHHTLQGEPLLSVCGRKPLNQQNFIEHPDLRGITRTLAIGPIDLEDVSRLVEDVLWIHRIPDSGHRVLFEGSDFQVGRKGIAPHRNEIRHSREEQERLFRVTGHRIRKFDLVFLGLIRKERVQIRREQSSIHAISGKPCVSLSEKIILILPPTEPQLRSVRLPGEPTSGTEALSGEWISEKPEDGGVGPFLNKAFCCAKWALKEE